MGSDAIITNAPNPPSDQGCQESAKNVLVFLMLSALPKHLIQKTFR
jgi:hypothetical protein